MKISKYINLLVVYICVQFDNLAPSFLNWIIVNISSIVKLAKKTSVKHQRRQNMLFFIKVIHNYLTVYAPQ